MARLFDRFSFVGIYFSIFGGQRRDLVNRRPSLLGWRPLLVGWRPSLLGLRALLVLFYVWWSTTTSKALLVHRFHRCQRRRQFFHRTDSSTRSIYVQVSPIKMQQRPNVELPPKLTDAISYERNKCIASSNKGLTSSNRKLLVTSASLLVTRALLVVTRSY